MKLTRLRLIGFKSFVEPTDFQIEPGLTGVVVPNGCGKSNLVEALRWVMGEASHKAMRAAGMDDVIFSGNTVRPGRNAAEVAMTIDNSAHTAPVHQGRIGEIIQAKPEQRRRVLEEAAGISGLHARRHEAELRLRAAEQNLARLEDVIGQLGGQIDALKRQSRQAVRYRALSQQIRKAEAALYHLRHVNATAEVANAEHAKDVSIRVVAERTGAQ